MRHAPRFARCLMLAALALPVLACFGRLIANPSALVVDGERPGIDDKMRADARAVGNDLTRLFLPHHMRIAERVARTGRLPLWDPAGFGGRPLVGNPQAGLFYPPVWLAWWAGSPAALGWLTVAHLIWGALGTFALCRAVGLDRFASWVGASCFATAPYMLAQVYEGHYPHVWAASWYPWAFWTFRNWRTGNPRAGLLVSLILALTFLAGHPQEGYYLGLVLSAWLAIDLWRSFRTVTRARGADNNLDNNYIKSICCSPAFRHAVWRAGGWFVVVALSIGLVAVELIPDARVHGWTLRGTRLTLREASKYHVNPLNLLQLLSPSALGGPAEYFGHDNYWESIFSIGWTPLILLVAGCLWSSRRDEVRGWGALLLVASLFAAGRRLGVFALLYQLVPGMERFRVPARSLFLANLAAAVLAGLGVEVLRTIRVRALVRRYWGFVAGLACALLVAQGAAWWLGVGYDTPSLYSSGEGDGHWNRYRELGRVLRGCSTLVHTPAFWSVLLATGGAIFWLHHTPERRRSATFAVGLLAVVELAAHGFGVIKVAPTSRFLGVDPIADALDRSPLSHPFRIRARDAFYPDLCAIARGLEKTNLNDYFQIQIAADLYENLYPLFGPTRPIELQDPETARKNRGVQQAVLDRMNVAYLVTDRPLADAPWPIFESGSWGTRDYTVYQNRSVLPRAYVVPRAEVVDESESVVTLPRVAGREAVTMTADPLTSIGRRQSFTPADYDSSDPDCIRVRVTTDAPGLLVVADTWFPGWTAQLDGRTVPILRGNHCQRVIPLPQAGRHEVIMRYHAPGLMMGLTITALSAGVWLLAWAVPPSFISRRARVHDGSDHNDSKLNAQLEKTFLRDFTTAADPLTPTRAACEETTRA